jgi:hypothetical protein
MANAIPSVADRDAQASLRGIRGLRRTVDRSRCRGNLIARTGPGGPPPVVPPRMSSRKSGRGGGLERIRPGGLWRPVSASLSPRSIGASPHRLPSQPSPPIRATTRPGISSPRARHAVAPGEGAFRTWTDRFPSPKRKSSTRLPFRSTVRWTWIPRMGASRLGHPLGQPPGHSAEVRDPGFLDPEGPFRADGGGGSHGEGDPPGRHRERGAARAGHGLRGRREEGRSPAPHRGRAPDRERKGLLHGGHRLRRRGPGTWGRPTAWPGRSGPGWSG